MSFLSLTRLFILGGVFCMILVVGVALPKYVELFLFAVAFMCAIGGFVCGLMHLRNDLR